MSTLLFSPIINSHQVHHDDTLTRVRVKRRHHGGHGPGRRVFLVQICLCVFRSGSAQISYSFSVLNFIQNICIISLIDTNNAKMIWAACGRSKILKTTSLSLPEQSQHTSSSSLLSQDYYCWALWFRGEQTWQQRHTNSKRWIIKSSLKACQTTAGCT